MQSIEETVCAVYYVLLLLLCGWARKTQTNTVVIRRARDEEKESVNYRIGLHLYILRKQQKHCTLTLCQRISGAASTDCAAVVRYNLLSPTSL